MAVSAGDTVIPNSSKSCLKRLTFTSAIVICPFSSRFQWARFITL